MTNLMVTIRLPPPRQWRAGHSVSALVGDDICTDENTGMYLSRLSTDHFLGKKT